MELSLARKISRVISLSIVPDTARSLSPGHHFLDRFTRRMHRSICTAQATVNAHSIFPNCHRPAPRLHPQHKSFRTRARTSLSRYALQALLLRCEYDLEPMHERILPRSRKKRFHPRNVSSSTDLSELFKYLDERASSLGLRRTFKTLRKAMYNACKYNVTLTWSVYQEIVKHNVAALLEEKDYVHLLKVMKYGDTSIIPQLRQVLQDMRSTTKGTPLVSPKAYSQVLFALARHGQGKQACELMEDMRRDGLTPDANHYISLALSAKNEGDRATIQRVADLILAAVVKDGIELLPEICSLVVSGLSKTSGVNAAAVFLKKADNLLATRDTLAASTSDVNRWKRYNVQTYTSLISGLAESGEADKAQLLFDEMKKQGIRPTIVTYSALIESYGKAGMIEEAVRVFKLYTYEHGKSKLNRVMATSLLTNAIRHDRLDTAQSLLSYWVTKMNLDPKDMDSKFRAAMMWVNVKESIERGRGFFLKMYKEDKKYVNEVMVNHLVIAGGNARSRDDVLDSYAMHHKVHGDENVSPSLRAHHHMVDALFKCRDVPAALMVFVSMRNRGLPDDITLAMVIRGLVMNDDDEIAWRLFKTLKSGGVEPNLHAYTSLLKAVAKRQPHSNNKHIPNELLEAAGLPNSSKNSGTDLQHVKAYHFFRTMTGYHQPNVYTYTTLIICFSKHNLGRAVDVFVNMCADRIEPTVVTYTVLLQGCAIFRNAQLALLLFKHMQDQKVTPNKHTWHYLLKALRRSRMEKSDIDRIGKLARNATM